MLLISKLTPNKQKRRNYFQVGGNVHFQVNNLQVYMQTHNPELGILPKSGTSFVIQVSSLLLKALLSSLAKQETP